MHPIKQHPAASPRPQLPWPIFGFRIGSSSLIVTLMGGGGWTQRPFGEFPSVFFACRVHVCLCVFFAFTVFRRFIKIIQLISQNQKREDADDISHNVGSDAAVICCADGFCLEACSYMLHLHSRLPGPRDLLSRCRRTAGCIRSGAAWRKLSVAVCRVHEVSAAA